MSVSAPKIFISANPTELGVVRFQVADLLRKAGADVSLPGPSVPVSPATLQQAAQLIYASDIVILLIGKKSGPTPSAEGLAATFQAWEAAAPGFTQRLGFGPHDCPSVAQLEARLAYALGKKVFPILCADDYPAEEQGNEPASAAQQQAAHRAMLAGLMQGTPPSSTKALLKLVEALPIGGLSWPQARLVRPRKKVWVPAAAALVLSLGISPLCAWIAHLKSATPDDLAATAASKLDTSTARPLMMEAVMESQAPDFVGYEMNARQRMDDAMHRVEQNHGLALGTLRHALNDPRGAFSLSVPMDRETSYLRDLLQESYPSLREHGTSMANDPSDIPASSDPKALERFMIAIAACNSQNMLLPAAEIAKKCHDPAFSIKDLAQRVRHELVIFVTLFHQGHSALIPGYWDTTLADLSHLPADQQEKFAALKLRVRTWQARQWINEGKYGNAQGTLKSVAEEVSKKFGPDSMEHVLVLDELAHALIKDARFQEAEQVLHECDQIHIRTATSEHPAYATTCLRNSELALAQSSLKVAENSVKTALDIRNRIFSADNCVSDADHRAILECHTQLGLVLQKQGKLDEAEKLLTAALTSQEILCGKDSQPTSIARRQAAMIWHELGALEKSLNALQQCQKEQFLFRDTPDYAMTLDCLGVVSHDYGSQQDPYKNFLEAQDILEKTVGHEHPLVALVLTHAASAHLDFDSNYSAAESTLNRALSIVEQRGMGSNLQTAETLFELGRCLQRLGRYEEAEQKEQRAFDVCWSKSGEDSVQTAVILHRLARCQIDLGKETDALSNHHRADAILGNKLADSHYLRCQARLYEALTYRTAGKLPEAIRAATQAYEGFHKIMESGTFWSNESANLINECTLQYLTLRFPPHPGESPAEYLKRLQDIRENGGRDPSPAFPADQPTGRPKVTI